jgi:hypothetical protein
MFLGFHQLDKVQLELLLDTFAPLGAKFVSSLPLGRIVALRSASLVV